MNIKEIISASGMSQAKFAAHYGIPWRTVSNWMRGVNTCPEYLTRLLEAAETQRKENEMKDFYWWVVIDNGAELEARRLPAGCTRSEAIADAEQCYDKHYTRREQKALDAYYVALAPMFDDDDDGPERFMDFDREAESVDVLWVLRYWDEITELMDDEIREALHAEGYDTKTEFYEAYAKAHKAKFGTVFTI